MDNSEMLIDLIDHYTGGNKSQFAKLLGVSQQVISQWLARGTMNKEKVYKQLGNISAHWLLTDGEGEMIVPEVKESPPSDDAKHLKKRIGELERDVNYAIDEGMTANYPFKRFKIRRELSPKRALSLDEMGVLWHYQPTTSSQAWYLDIFRLSFCLCGLNIVDLANLTPSNVQGRRIVLQRQKTGSLLSILIEPEAAELLKRLRGNGYLINIRNHYKSHRDFIRRCNEGLKRLGTITKREGRGGRIVERERLFPTLSTYYARHSWASIAAELGASVETISLGLGHRYGSAVTQTYITPSLRLLDECNRMVLDAVAGDSLT